MLSAQQLSILDIILRKLWHVRTPFGGVLVFGTMDHAQFSAINGLPFLLSTHLLTDFTLVGLKHSMRATDDPELQKLQNMTRVNPWWLIENQEIEKPKFCALCRNVLTFIPSWDDPSIDRHTLRMFARRKPAQKAGENMFKMS